MRDLESGRPEIANTERPHPAAMTAALFGFHPEGGFDTGTAGGTLWGTAMTMLAVQDARTPPYIMRS
jgi:hypothetical protein